MIWITENMPVSTNIELLLTSGCSCSEVQYPFNEMDKYIQTSDHPLQTFTWPVHLMNALNCRTQFLANGGSGNKIISASILHALINALREVDKSKILVGVMWSGSYRYSIYKSSQPLDYHKIEHPTKFSIVNPLSLVGNKNNNYYKVMPYWNDNLSKTYYKHFFDEIGSVIETIENILRVQWFVKLHEIKCFMTFHHALALPKKHLSHPDVKYLYESIDMDMFLPVNDQWNWLENNGYPDINKKIGTKDCHPTTEMHEKFTQEVIIPFLKNKNYIK